MATHTFCLDGTFSLQDLEHITRQVEGLPFPLETVLEGAGYGPYEYEARRIATTARRFKGKISIVVEELPFPGIPHKPEPEPEPTEEEA